MIPFNINLLLYIIVEAIAKVPSHNTYHLYTAGVLKTHTYDNEIQYNVEKYNSIVTHAPSLKIILQIFRLSITCNKSAKVVDQTRTF